MISHVYFYNKLKTILQSLLAFCVLKTKVGDSYSASAPPCEKWHLTPSRGWKWLSQAYYIDGKHLDSSSPFY